MDPVADMRVLTATGIYNGPSVSFPGGTIKIEGTGLFSIGGNIASASTIALGAATGDYVTVTGTTTITSLGSGVGGGERWVIFNGALILTHNATSLILPTGANITTAAGDVAVFRSLGSSNWRCVLYQRKSGIAIGTDQGTSQTDSPLFVNLGLTGNLDVDNIVTILGQLIAAGTVTNDSAGAGYIGQIISSLVATGSAVSLTSTTAANVTSLSLTAGDWDVEGNVNFNCGSTTLTASSAGIFATSATLPTDGSEVANGLQLTTTTAINGITLPRKRVSIASTTSIYLVARAVFGAGTVAAWGGATARRVR